ncbi:hypothetical protein DD238_006196 [Peronospora effusa]|uniref:Inositol polyphosphate-related phosphatase domain-containing protein n=1 Tax=Peronospora effusa TaxID=542832 RepID=A0A3M6VAC6_9STRA|nr:hypothetical protein DD238_006196 [Peronospora effusa]
MSDRNDAGPSESLSAAQETRLQLTGYFSSALSLAGTLYVLIHYGYVHWCRPSALKLPQQQLQLPRRRQVDFMDKLVFVLALFDLVTIAARAVGRSVMHDSSTGGDYTSSYSSQLYLDLLHGLQSLPLDCGWRVGRYATKKISTLFGHCTCAWSSCCRLSPYDTIRGDNVIKVVTVAFSLLCVVWMVANKYGDATFYCWLDEIRYMFLNFYLFYLLMIIFNFVLLALIHLNMKQRVARHDTMEADTSSTLIRRKLLLYIVVFIAHRTPMMIYRRKLAALFRFLHCEDGVTCVYFSLKVFEAGGMDSLSVGLTMQVIQDLNGFSNSIVYGGICHRRAKKLPLRRDCEAESLSSSTNSIAGGCAAKECTAIAEDDLDAIFGSSARIRTTLTLSGHKISSELESRDSYADRNAHHRMTQVVSQEERSPGYLTWHQRLQKRLSTPSPSSVEAKKIVIFTSTFNMGEKDVNESELCEWIPLEQDVYVIGVQECMDLADFQIKILRHLVSGSTSRYVRYSREIGKRATALGYHGYIALCIFVRATAVSSGRFRMRHRQSSNKKAQEVFCGKSLLVFGRASNKGAVGMSFRFDDTSFAFATCHLASDSSSLKRAKRKRSSNAVLQCQKRGDAVEANLRRSSDRDSGSKASLSDGTTTKVHQFQSKLERRNRDAMEILQQLYLDEEDYGFGFQHLHHHSFILGDFNYRMTRRSATPMDMLELLVNAGTEYHNTRDNVYTLNLSSPCSPVTLPTSTRKVFSHDNESDFRQCITPRMQSPSTIAATQKSLRDRPCTSTCNMGSHSPPFLLRSLVEEHDELYQLCRSQQIFHGFKENEIAFFPTFRRIRGQALRQPLDAVMFQQNYSLVATHGGYRVPSYTDRVLYSSLAGTEESLRCLSYNSCEAVTSSDHKPVSACFEISLLASTQKPSPTLPLAEDSQWNADSTGANPMVLHAHPSAGTLAAARMKDVPGACELRLRIKFRSIHWVDAVDSALFDRAEHVQFGFLFPLPCEDVFAPQRKLHEVAEHLTFGGFDTRNTGDIDFASTVTPVSNFYTMRWHEFVNSGLRYHTTAGSVGRKHVAVVLRSLGRGRTMSKTTSASQLLGRSSSLSPHTSANSIASTCSSTYFNTSVSSSSLSSKKLFGHGTFCAEGMMKKRDVCVPLTLGGRLLGRLQLRVSLQMRQTKHADSR